MDIVILGPYPPPLGGNSVHVQRLMQLLQATQYTVRVLDIFTAKADAVQKPCEVENITGCPLRKIRLLIAAARQTSRDTIVHMHVSAMERFKWLAPFLLLLFYRQPKVLTIHSGSFVQQVDTPGLRFCVKQVLRRFDGIIAVNVEQSAYLKTVLKLSPAAFDVIPAFLPPTPDVERMPDTIKAVIGRKTLVVTSGYLTPLYNYDLLIDCIAALDRQVYHFVFAFYHTVDFDYEAHILARLADIPNITILRNQPPDVFAGVLSQSDIYVRTTRTDGDAVAIREAIYFNKTVFASDCVVRPDVCLLFKSGDSADLLRLFKTEHYTSHQVSDNNFQRILEIYRLAAASKGKS